MSGFRPIDSLPPTDNCSRRWSFSQLDGFNRRPAVFHLDRKCGLDARFQFLGLQPVGQWFAVDVEKLRIPGNLYVSVLIARVNDKHACGGIDFLNRANGFEG